MSEEEILEDVKRVLTEQLALENKEIALSAQIVDDLGADSLDLVEIAMALEDEFGIEIPDEEVETIHTVEDVVKFIHNRIND